jgi:hypothetical protein
MTSPVINNIKICNNYDTESNREVYLNSSVHTLNFNLIDQSPMKSGKSKKNSPLRKADEIESRNSKTG